MTNELVLQFVFHVKDCFADLPCHNFHKKVQEANCNFFCMDINASVDIILEHARSSKGLFSETFSSFSANLARVIS